MNKVRFIGSIIILGIVSSVSIAFSNTLIQRTAFDDWSDDSEYYIARGLSLVEKKTLGEESVQFRRPPAYSAMLAVAFTLLGKHVYTIWILHTLLFSASLWLLYRIASEILPGWIAYLPSVMASVYWGITFYVFEVGSEILALFLLLLLTYLVYKYNGRYTYVGLLLFAVFGSIFALTKPITLYILPILLLYSMRNQSWRIQAPRMVIVVAIIAVIVGSWMYRTYALFGEYQIERPGHIVFTRAIHATRTAKEISTHTLAAITGDYITDKVVPGYGTVPMAQTIGIITKDALRVLVNDGQSRKDAEQDLFRQGIALIVQNPIGYMGGSIPLLLDLNTPENIRGFPVTRMFVGTHESKSVFQKITIITLIRGTWYIFLGFVIYGMYRAIFEKCDVGVLVLLILFFNGAHVFLIAPTEPRFIMPVLPFYFIFFILGLYHIIKKHQLIDGHIKDI
jgi:hypothetical protein